MGILLKPFVLDMIIIFYVMIMIFLGYKKGFLVRLYDFLSTLLSLLIAYEISFPISKIWIIYQLQPPFQDISENINQFFVAVIIFIIFKLACLILGVFLKPMLKKVVSFLKLTELFDHLLGIVLSFAESLIFIYLTLVLIVSPLFHHGQDIIDNSVIAGIITQSIEQYAEEITKFDMIQDFTNIDLEKKDSACVMAITNILYTLDTNDFVDDDTLKTFIESYYQDVQDISVDQETYDLLTKMCQKHQIDIHIIQGIEVKR
ncbi:MAG: CvpA family protein [Faecalibacillus sp.]